MTLMFKMISNTKSKDANNGNGWCYSVKQDLQHPTDESDWKVHDGEWKVQPSVKVRRVQHPLPPLLSAIDTARQAHVDDDDDDDSTTSRTQANPLGGAMSTPKPAAPGAVVAGAGVSSAQGPAQGQQLPLPTDPNALCSEIMGIVSKYNPKLGSKEKIMSHINKHTQNAGGNTVLGMQNLLKQLRGKYLTGTATAAFTSAAAGVPSTPNPPLTHTGKIADDGLSVFCMKQPLLSHPFSLAHLSPPLRLRLIDPLGVASLFFGACFM